MGYYTFVNVTLRPDGQDAEEYAKAQHVHTLRERNREPALDPSWAFTWESPAWVQIRCETMPLRSDGEKARDEGRHQCVLESKDFDGEELPFVQCFERDGKLWLAAYDHEWEIQYCPKCGFNLEEYKR